jgi:hypothetical protein
MCKGGGIASVWGTAVQNGVCRASKMLYEGLRGWKFGDLCSRPHLGMRMTVDFEDRAAPSLQALSA